MVGPFIADSGDERAVDYLMLRVGGLVRQRQLPSRRVAVMLWS